MVASNTYSSLPHPQPHQLMSEPSAWLRLVQGRQGGSLVKLTLKPSRW